MKLERYTVVSDIDHVAYEFLSVGPRGTIRKFVFYEKIGDDIYNLSFGDWVGDEAGASDTTRSNNNDREKVLLTVASTIPDFIKHYPDAVIIARGSTASRTRLCQMTVAANLNMIKESFTILGYAEGQWQAFLKGRNYAAFSIKAK